MKMTAVNSPEISGLDYDDGDLTIFFRPSGAYRYYGVPECVYERLLTKTDYWYYLWWIQDRYPVRRVA